TGSKKEKAASKFAIGPMGSDAIRIPYKNIFMTIIIVPPRPPNMIKPIKAGMSDKSNIKNGGKKGKGNRINIKINDKALKILILMIFFKRCLSIFFSPDRKSVV